MASYGKSYASPEEVYAFKILDYAEEVRRIKGGEEKLQAVNDGEGFLFPLLSEAYYDSNKKLTIKYEEKYRGNFLALANARYKLQMREVERSNILGAAGIRAIPKRKTKEEVNVIKEELEKSEEELEE